MSPDCIEGSVITRVRGDVAAGAVPAGVCHAIAHATTYDLPEGTIDRTAAEFVIGYALTVVPNGNEAAGIVNEPLALPEPSGISTFVDSDDTIEEGLPKVVGAIPVGGGATTGLEAEGIKLVDCTEKGPVPTTLIAATLKL